MHKSLSDSVFLVYKHGLPIPEGGWNMAVPIFKRIILNEL